MSKQTSFNSSVLSLLTTIHCGVEETQESGKDHLFTASELAAYLKPQFIYRNAYHQTSSE